jgi:hypothetical protein
MPPVKQPVSEQALVKRINRRLAQKWKEDAGFPSKRLCISRPNSRLENNMGRYFAVDHTNTVQLSHLNLEEFGRELKCLAPWEELVD